MIVINNKEEFESFYPYDKKFITEYPIEYPCVCNWVYEGGGLVGDIKQVYVAYFPKNTSKNTSKNESFLIGLGVLRGNPWKTLK